MTQRFRPAEPILVAARGDAFDFQIYPVYTWTGEALSTEDMKQRVAWSSNWARGIVQEQVAGVAREHDPHRAWDLEQTLNARMRSSSWPRGGNTAGLSFTVQVRVFLDERMRERLRPYWEERIRLECDHELNLLRTRLADELTRRWRDVLQNLEKDPVMPHAARLTGERFAEVFGAFTEEQRQAVPDLVELLRQAVKGHNDLGMGPSEYTEAWDAALKTFRQQHGLAEKSD